MSTINNAKEKEAGTSPYKTRSKRKNENLIHDPREFQDTALITIKEKPLRIYVGYCYLVSLSNKVGWLRIDKMWMYDDVLKMEATCFTKPNAWQSKRSECGEDHLVAHNAKLLLNEDRFKRMYIHKENANQTGSNSISLTEIVKREKDTLTYYQMKSSKSDITHNVSASAIVHSLGFARFNAGAKKKTSTGPARLKRGVQAIENVALVLSYKEYCMCRKLKKLLEAGGIVSKEECDKYHVVTEKTVKLFFYVPQTNYSPRDDWMEVMDGIDDLMFEKFSKESKEADLRLKRITRKYRRQSI